MKKILLSLAMLLTGVGAWAQETLPTPAVSMLGLEDQTLPYVVPDDKASEMAEMDDMTIVMVVKTPAGLTNSRMLICGSDPTQEISTDVVKDNSPYFGYGFVGSNLAYIASAKSGQHFSYPSGVSTSSIHFIAFVINVTDGNVSSYVDGVKTNMNINDGASGYKIQTFKKLFSHETYGKNAKIYIGGSKVWYNESEDNYYSFGGTVYNVRVYDSALTAEQIKDVYDATGIAKPGNFYRISYDYGVDGGVRYMQAIPRSAANSHLVYNEETGASSIFYYGDGKLLSYSAGKYVKEDGSSRGLQNIGTQCSAEIIPSKRDISKCVLDLGSYLHANSSNGEYYSDHCSGNDHATHDHKVEKVTTLPVTIGETGYASFFAPVAVTLPEGEDLKAYYVSTADETKATMVEVEDGVIPANTGVILQGTESTTYDLTIGGEGTVEGNKLTGTVASSYVNASSYVLAKPESGSVGFYLAELNKNSSGATVETDGTHFLNNGFKAYLPVANLTTSAGARLLFDFGTETGIDCIESVEATKDAVVYDLAGRRVQGAQKGLYIVNGKVVVK